MAIKGIIQSYMVYLRHNFMEKTRLNLSILALMY